MAATWSEHSYAVEILSTSIKVERGSATTKKFTAYNIRVPSTGRALPLRAALPAGSTVVPSVRIRTGR